MLDFCIFLIFLYFPYYTFKGLPIKASMACHLTFNCKAVDSDTSEESEPDDAGGIGSRFKATPL